MIYSITRPLQLSLTMLVLCLSAFSASAATRTTLNGQVFGLARQIKRALNENPLVEGQQIQLGDFQAAEDAGPSNFGRRIEELLRVELRAVLTNGSSALRLTGNYHFVDSSEPNQKNIKILLITARIVDQRDRELVSLAVEVNDTDNVMQVLGLTGAASIEASESFQQRNQSLQLAQAKPSFKTLAGNLVAAESQPNFAVGLQTKSSITSKAKLVSPEDRNGLAFVPVGIGEYYEIIIANNDTIDAVATITIDGLDATNTFSTDKDANGKKIHWPGYFVPAGSKVVVRGWLQTINQKSKENLFSFRVDEFGKNIDSALKPRGSVGVVTVQFREACSPDSRLSGRSFGETVRGETLQEKLTARKVLIGENVLSTVSLRYNRPENGK